MPNRLANESSPYLLQHQDNPVDWYPWAGEAFARAREEDKPVFLSVGYSSCHWCHVMEHESFEDEGTARLLNDGFVCVKVDREERPDVDEAYMTAVQLSAGRGGWPMSVFMTPDKKPFFAGTYFPKEERGGHPSFTQVLEQVAAVWSQERHRVYEIANQYADAIRQSREQTIEATVPLGAELLAECVRAHTMDFDEEQGGFGQAPKFPPHTAIEFLLNYAIAGQGDEELRQSAADMAIYTLQTMALGGIHDQVGGGFHRYSTDERWLLPHFEKMLYDNALMLGNYARAAALCRDQLPELETLFDSVATGIVRWLREEMTSPDGLFYAALDADSEGEEGKFYVWTWEEVERVLGQEAETFQGVYQFHPDGNFRDEATGLTTGANIPFLLEQVGNRFDSALEKLRVARAQRVRPGLDDKCLISWNGLAIGALAEAAELGMAERAAEAVLAAEQTHGGLPHQVAKGMPAGTAFLEDYACVVDGLITLAGVKGMFADEALSVPGQSAEYWLGQAQRLASEMIERFYDSEKGGFFSSSTGHEDLFGRTKPTFDQPVSSGNAVAAKCLVELGDEQRAWQTVRALAGWMERAPTATEALHLVLMSLLEEHEVSVEAPEPIQNAVEVRLVNSRLIATGGVAGGEIEIQIPTGMHINSPQPPARWLVPTEVSVQPLKYRVSYPMATEDRYEGIVAISFEVDLPEGSSGEEFEVTVKFQACTESECQLPQDRRFGGVAERR